MLRETSNTRGAIIFDGDDTLWETQAIYDRAKEHFYHLMGQQGFNECAVKEKFGQVDAENVKTMGFSMHRFPRSMQDVYKYFCIQNNYTIDPAICDQILRIGYSVFDNEPVLMPGARDVLEQLSKLYDLYLFTSGDLEIQKRKLAQVKILPFFRKSFIKERKDESELSNIIESEALDIKRSWMIGNSPRSDINPALKVGLRCIWIRGGTWEYDEEILVEGQVWAVSSLLEIPSILLEADYSHTLSKAVGNSNISSTQ